MSPSHMSRILENVRLANRLAIVPICLVVIFLPFCSNWVQAKTLVIFGAGLALVPICSKLGLYALQRHLLIWVWTAAAIIWRAKIDVIAETQHSYFVSAGLAFAIIGREEIGQLLAEIGIISALAILNPAPGAFLPDVEVLPFVIEYCRNHHFAISLVFVLGLFLVQTQTGHRFLLQEEEKVKLLEQEMRKRKQAEKSLAEAYSIAVDARKAAEQANKAKAQFLANMSHDIRTPIAGVIGMSRLLLEMPLRAQEREYARVIHGSADNLLVILNDILDFSKVDAGQMELEYAPFNVRDTVEQVLDLLADTAQSKNLEIAAFVDEAVPPCILGDVGRVRQILINLVGNAVKFTNEGEVNIHVGVYETNMIRFVVQDTGIGVAQDASYRLFQPFTQADASTTRKYGGTGLGLAICRKLCALMGGDIGMESVLGKGSTFWFTVQTAMADDPEKPVFNEKLESLRHSHCLVIIEHNTARASLSEQLVGSGFEVEECDGVDVGVEYLERANDFAVVILDVTPLGGLELLRRFHAGAVNKRPALIALTAARLPQEWRDEVEQLATLVTKPLHRRLLEVAIVDAVFGVQDSPGTPTAQTSPQPLQLLNTPRLSITIQPPEKSTTSALPPAMAAPQMSEHMSRPQPAEGPSDPAPAERPKRRGTVIPSSLSQLGHVAVGTKILLVDDNVVNQMMGKAMLQRLGATVEVAKNGREAVAAVERNRFDLVFMDCQMPEMDGYEATTQIRQREMLMPSVRHVPIVAMTASAMNGDRDKCLSAGMNDYLSKPVRPETLATIISRHLVARRVSEPNQTLGPPMLPHSRRIHSGPASISSEPATTAASPAPTSAAFLPPKSFTAPASGRTSIC
eukprot:TRINITY_DN334_c0_g1_i1.p1 TRINITY_DN334_c0_g1~~TRINITY_DN334_c0_g1_i1.p1  ORF type:complete len:857 (+),score=162.51 TRINITY_DN334_c0_g1_i1:56-2626(+)